MDARNSNGRLTRLAVLGLIALLAVGLWQAYGRWALDAVMSHGQ